MLSFNPRPLKDDGLVDRETKRIENSSLSTENIINLKEEVKEPRQIDIPEFRSGHFSIAKEKDRFGFDGIFDYKRDFRSTNRTERELFGKYHVSSAVEEFNTGRKPYKITTNHEPSVKDTVELMKPVESEKGNNITGYVAPSSGGTDKNATWDDIKERQQLIDMDKDQILNDKQFLSEFKVARLNRKGAQSNAGEGDQLAKTVDKKIDMLDEMTSKPVQLKTKVKKSNTSSATGIPVGSVAGAGAGAGAGSGAPKQPLKSKKVIAEMLQAKTAEFQTPTKPPQVAPGKSPADKATAPSVDDTEPAVVVTSPAPTTEQIEFMNDYNDFKGLIDSQLEILNKAKKASRKQLNEQEAVQLISKLKSAVTINAKTRSIETFLKAIEKEFKQQQSLFASNELWNASLLK
jgi:hypothetical protein